MNRLKNEKSPYLLQHADNPVDWFPWGTEAFDRAKSEDKPVFLSIGYSTCHWCHVMAHESFEDTEVAAALNRDFICIKVDREERPDVDAVYMSVCQALTGSGGWPLTVLLTPEQKPFWAGTYLPKNTFGGQTGLLSAVTRQWNTSRDKLLSSSEQITAFLQAGTDSANTPSDPGKSLLHDAAGSFLRSYDKQWGGFGSPPKFPVPHNLLFLLRYSVLEKDEPSRHMSEHTLTQMFRGGLFDHLGGGFCRYSTDRKWLVPHFEKMLYDNALLVYVYLEAFQMTRRPLYRRIVQRTLDYVLRELTDQQGGFYCGQDADSDGEEGRYYVFTPEEIRRVLGENEGESFCRYFSITEKGNFERKSILNLLENPRYEEQDARMDALCIRLYDYRLTRTKLHRDDKVLTSWNALMIAALAKAGHLLSEPSYLEAAKKAQHFLEKNLMDSRGRLLLRWREGEAAHNGLLDDYAFYAFALLELYRSTFELCYLQRAAEIAKQIPELFSGSENGGFYLYSKDSEQLISRPKEVYDGALPSGNSMAAIVLRQLFLFTGEESWRQIAKNQLRFVAGAAKDSPAGHSAALLALCSALYPSRELVCVTSEKKVPEKFLSFLRENPLPNLTMLLKSNDNQQPLSAIAPFTADYPVPESGERFYLCQDGSCLPPMSSPEELKRLLS